MGNKTADESSYFEHDKTVSLDELGPPKPYLARGVVIAPLVALVILVVASIVIMKILSSAV
jgi:hypothetical protein